MHETLSQHERKMLTRAHLDLSQVVGRFDEVAWALPGPVPATLRDDYEDALGLALASVRFAARQGVGGPLFAREVDGLESLGRESLAALPDVVDDDQAMTVPDWAIVGRWLSGGAA